MEWNVAVGNKSTIIKLPDQLPSGTPFLATMNGREIEVLWQRSTRTLLYRPKGEVQAWRSIYLRRSDIVRFPGESDTNVSIEVVPPQSMMATSLEATVGYHLPGQGPGSHAKKAKSKNIRSQITGKVLKVLVKPGQTVEAQAPLLVIEAMKMENRVLAPDHGVIDSIVVQEGATVSVGQDLIRFK
jgi:acetyl-CoA carboxylase biotin carboxyl carrier protein